MCSTAMHDRQISVIDVDNNIGDKLMTFSGLFGARPRFALLGLAACFACASASVTAAESTYPNKPITIVVPFSPGGGTDALARAVGARLQEKIGTPVIVDNRPGAGGPIGAAFAAHSALDGDRTSALS